MTVLCDSCSPREGCTAEKNRTECKFYQPMTEQEYIQTCNTEQLAEFINDVSKKCYTCGEGYTPHPAYCPFHKCLRGSVYGITEWLKQPHTKE